MAASKNGVPMCGVCGRKWKDGSGQLFLWKIPVPAGDSYLMRRERICPDCRDFIERLTRRKVVEIGEEVEERRKRFRKTKYE